MCRSCPAPGEAGGEREADSTAQHSTASTLRGEGGRISQWVPAPSTRAGGSASGSQLPSARATQPVGPGSQHQSGWISQRVPAPSTRAGGSASGSRQRSARAGRSASGSRQRSARAGRSASGSRQRSARAGRSASGSRLPAQRAEEGLGPSMERSSRQRPKKKLQRRGLGGSAGSRTGAEEQVVMLCEEIADLAALETPNVSSSLYSLHSTLRLQEV
ncbi:uncharacterized protein LOC127044495 [Gopherus flavomarginatus]|uniref:uncharacterized protein LOC127044495 n=1 Tax=Gopherus flavomarginatus TaxID=286002 RepID=UPI0021CBE537|nr:uncharacterized protein LOC127044495 [Gopherus flavomarginatus]